MYCGGGGGGDGGETCQLVTAPRPELSSKLGIKCCDGQKIGWEFKEALSQRGGTADRLHAGPLPSPDSPHPTPLLTPPPRFTEMQLHAQSTGFCNLIGRLSRLPRALRSHWGGEDGRTCAGELWLGGRRRQQVLEGDWLKSLSSRRSTVWSVSLSWCT